MLLSEHVYYVTITFKMTKLVEQLIYIKVCIKLDCSTEEPIQMI